MVQRSVYVLKLSRSVDKRNHYVLAMGRLV